MGVIGFAAYTAQSYGGYRPAPMQPSYPRIGGELMKQAPSVPLASPLTFDVPRGSIGTGAGATIVDPIGRGMHFQRSGAPPQALEIGYDTEEALRELGVLRPRLPQAFPPRNTGYGKYHTM